MIFRNASLGKRVYLPTMGLFAISMCALFTVQHMLYVRTFETTLLGASGVVADAEARRGARHHAGRQIHNRAHVANR